MNRRQRTTRLIAVLLACSAWSIEAHAQDLEPRRWAHFPVGTNVAGVTYFYTDGEVFFDPVLALEDVEVDSHSTLVSYARWFPFFAKTARLDAILPYQTARWEGLLSGTPASTQRVGFADPWLRFSVNFLGSPALAGKEFQEYRAARPVKTVAGAAIGVMLPLGEYKPDKLLNLGQNRFIIRPQVGVVHTRGRWSFELTGSTFFFTDNNDFFGGNERDQAPLFAAQAHLIHSLPGRWWVSLSGGYAWGGESEINGERKNDERRQVLSAVSFGFPIGKAQAMKLVYLRGDTQTDVGRNSDNFLASWTIRF